MFWPKVRLAPDLDGEAERSRSRTSSHLHSEVERADIGRNSAIPVSKFPRSRLEGMVTVFPCILFVWCSDTTSADSIESSSNFESLTFTRECRMLKSILYFGEKNCPKTQFPRTASR